MLWISQTVFFCAVAWCYALSHSTSAQLDGISYWGVQSSTLPIIAIGFAAGGWGLWRTAHYLSTAGAPTPLLTGLRVTALGLPALLLTPYDRGPMLNWTHMVVGVVMGLVEFTLTSWLMLWRRTWATRRVWALQLAGGLLAGSSLPDWNFPHLLQGEIIFEVAFAWSLLEWVSALRAGLRDEVVT